VAEGNPEIKSMKIYFLVPVYNEALNIARLSENLLHCLPAHKKHYVFVDDGSTDNTVELIQASLLNLPFTVITKAQNAGPGDSFNMGFEWILSHSKDTSDLIVTVEGDNTSDLTILPDMVAISRLGYELVLASVYTQGGGFDKTSFFRKVISSIANMLFRFHFGIKVLTLSSFFRIYHVGLIRRIKEHFGTIIQEKGFISMLEVLVKAIRLDTRIIEVPMKLYSARRVGKSKMKIFRTTISYIRFLLKKKYV
jgi:dolichol-phosphate mannosyltransferase